MIKNFLKILLFIFICSCLFSCSKKVDDQPLNYKVPQEIKDWFYYKRGTYWIYQNQSQSTLDSLIVDSAYISEKYIPGEGHGADPFYSEEMKIVFQKNFLNLLYDDAGGYGQVVSRCFSDTSWYPIFDNTRNYIGVVDGFYYSNIGQQAGTTEILNYYDSYLIEDNIFQNVMIVQVKDFIKDRTINFYLARKIGTIQFQFIQKNDTANWVLKNWFIVK